MVFLEMLLGLQCIVFQSICCFPMIVGKINVVSNNNQISKFIIPEKVNAFNMLFVGNIPIPISDINNHIIPFDVDLNGYHVCFIKSSKTWKLAMIDSNIQHWEKSRLISTAQYLNLIFVSAGSIMARHELFLGE